MTLEVVFDVIQIIFANIVLSGDNALVIGMAAAGLSAKLRKRAIFIGMALAAGLRILFAITATYLLAIKGILIVGSALLAWVCWRFYNDLKEFIEIVSRDQIDQIINEQKLSQSGMVDNNKNIDIGRILGVQEMVTGKVSRVQVSPVNEIKENKNYTKRITVDYEYYTDENGKQKKRAVKGDVTARAKIFKNSRTANMTVSVTLLDVESAKILYSNSFNEEYKYEYEWASFSGDKRALSSKVKNLARKGAESAPSKGTMITKLSNKISKKLKRELTAKLD